MSRHYEEFEWINYLRGLPPAPASEMGEHLESCTTCKERLAFCRELAEFVADESMAEPPEEWVHQTVESFVPSAGSGETDHVFAGLTSDTFLQTASGMRSAATLNERRLSFETRQFRVDVTADVSERRLKSVVGNISSKSPDAVGSLEMSAELSWLNRTLTTRTNGLGEFFFLIDTELDGGPLELRFTFDGGSCITVLVPF